MATCGRCSRSLCRSPIVRSVLRPITRTSILNTPAPTSALPPSRSLWASVGLSAPGRSDQPEPVQTPAPDETCARWLERIAVRLLDMSVLAARLSAFQTHAPVHVVLRAVPLRSIPLVAPAPHPQRIRRLPHPSSVSSVKAVHIRVSSEPVPTADVQTATGLLDAGVCREAGADLSTGR
ncbi:hypothetical protein B0H10DRAFT_378335 [Mycena sp. CBHHK59/15]|nr:hypothetical protein B0H10DRAFT_378335 [Mycena sp. CBHHK59/15]